MTEKVLSFNPKRMRGVLLDLRRVLLNQLNSNIQGGSAMTSADENDVASYNTEGYISLSLATIESEMLQQIDSALGKIDSGEYGLCEGCEGEIGEARLTAIPHAFFCIACQERAELGLI